MENIENIIRTMTLEDKIALCSGDDFFHTKEMKKFGIPSFMMCDGPHGLRKQENAADMLGINDSVPATSFPTAATTACSWDSELLGEIGEAIAREAAAEKVALILGPGVNIKRNPLCGRNFEYFSEDPYLSGKLGSDFIKKAQKNGIGTSLKHFACNNQEYKRFCSDSVVDERTLREIYLTSFEIAVRESQPKSVMCAYNKINGTFCSDNQKLLNNILREEWGFQGAVVTDWGAMSNRIEGFKAGCDLSMPGGSAYMEKEVQEAVKSGELAEELINRSVRRVLRMIFDAEKAFQVRRNFDKENHNNLARQAAEQSAVLLKNEDNILPLDEDKKIVLIGHMAKEIRYQGAGSSHINPTMLINVIDALPDTPYVGGYYPDGSTDEILLSEAKKLSSAADRVIIFAGLPSQYESEGFDRKDMQMPSGHLRLIEEISEINKNTIVVLMAGSAVEVPWADKVKAILYMALPGQSGGEAVANLLYGAAVPSGKLAETWPVKYEDCISSSFYGSKCAQYREGIYVGYRYYEKAKVPVCYPFGFGLSYTTFSYKNLEVRNEGGCKYTVTLDITNTGETAGAEIIQLYVAAINSPVHRPLKELKGFHKIMLKRGETRHIELSLDDRSFAVWYKRWIVPKGDYQIMVGSSSADIQLQSKISVQGEEIDPFIQQKDSWNDTLQGLPSKDGFEKTIGSRISEEIFKKGCFTMSNTVMEMKDYSLVMMLMYKGIEKQIAKGFGGKPDYNNQNFLLLLNASADCSLSGMKINGGFNNYCLEGLLAIANGQYIKGIKMFLNWRK